MPFGGRRSVQRVQVNDWPHVIAHIDIDAFYASVELLRRPELAGKPVIVSGNSPRAVVTTASYEARKFGVGSAMPASRARRLCPDAVVIPPDFEAYRETSKAVWETVRTRLDRVQGMGLDEAYADLTGVPKRAASFASSARWSCPSVISPSSASRSAVFGPMPGTRLVGAVANRSHASSRLVAKCCSDHGKPAGLVAMGREGPTPTEIVTPVFSRTSATTSRSTRSGFGTPVRSA